MPQAAEKFSLSHFLNHCRHAVMRVGRARLLFILMLLALGLWIVFAKLVVPPLIESAYRGESWSFLNRMISGQDVYSVHYYIQMWERLSLVCLVCSVGFLLILLIYSSPTLSRKIVGDATPGTLGAIRMWTCAILLLTTLLEDFGSIAWLPTEVRFPRGLLGYLYPLPLGLETLVTSEMSLRGFHILTAALLFLGLIGWRTRLVLPLAALCHFVLLGILIDYSFFWHQNLVPLYILTALCFTPCGDGWSVDRLRKIARGQTVPDAERASPVYGWSRYICWVILALPYVAAGLGKLRDGGFFWWNATSMRANLYADSLNPREFDWAFSLHLVHAPDVFFSLLGLFALCSETFFGFVLFSRLARRIFPVAAIMMHLGIFLLQRVLFIDLILLQFIFFDFTPLRKTVGVWLASTYSRLHGLYDCVAPHRHTSLRGDARGPVQPTAAGETAQATTTGNATRGFGSAVAVSGIILLVFLFWFFRVEFYPFTSWHHLYSHADTSGQVEYRKIFAQHASGASSRARLEDTIGALALDARYSRFLAKCFRDRPADVEICKTFLGAAAAAYNRKVQPSDRVTRYEIQIWKWDFRSQPFDTHYGHLTRRFVYEIDTGRAWKETVSEEQARSGTASSPAPVVIKDGESVGQ